MLNGETNLISMKYNISIPGSGFSLAQVTEKISHMHLDR